MLVEVAILLDMYKEEKAFGLWVTDGERMSQHYVSGYEEVAIRFMKNPGSLNVAMLDEEEWQRFWDYWVHQGGSQVWIRGPFKVEMDGDDVSAFGQRIIRSLDTFIEEWKGRGIFK